jgi:hypothetical protein
MACRTCGLNVPTKQVTFRQNIGMLLARVSKTLEGTLCKPCIHKRFWSMTGTTLAVGWLGTISLILAPVFIVGNVCVYVGAMCASWPAGD